MSARRAINLTTKLAAALCQMMRPTQNGGLERIIPHEEAKKMTADEIVSLFEFDHDPIPKACGGPDDPWNLTPRIKQEHREKTAKVDIPQIAKSKRLEKDTEAFRRRLLAKSGQGEEQPKKASRWPKRGFR